MNNREKFSKIPELKENFRHFCQSTIFKFSACVFKVFLQAFYLYFIHRLSQPIYI